MFTLQHVIFADYYGRESLGTIRGLVWPVQMMANAIGPLVAALAYDATGNYVVIFTIFAVFILLSSLCVFLAQPPVVMANAIPGDSRDSATGPSAS